VAELVFGTDEGIENSEDVAPVFNHARKYATEVRFALGVFVPLGENRRGNLDVAAQLVGGMSTEEQTVKESSLTLRKSKIRDHLSRQNWSDSCHSKKAVYSKLLRRQVERQFQCR
jgi:hypothetical protein